MKKTTKNAPPSRGPAINNQLEISAMTSTSVRDESPSSLAYGTNAEIFDRLLLVRIRYHDHFKGPSPLIFKISRGEKCYGSKVLSLWDRVGHGALAFEDRKLKMVYQDDLGRFCIMDAWYMTHLHSADPFRLTAAEWARLDLDFLSARGVPIVTLMDETHGNLVGKYQVGKVEAVTNLLGYYSFPSATTGWIPTTYILQRELRSTLSDFPDNVAKAFDSLGCELAGLCKLIESQAGAPPVAARFTEACIRGLIAAARSLAFHGLGWPRLHPDVANRLVSDIESRGWMSKANVCRLQRGLKAADRDLILEYLADLGVVTVERNTISAVEPAVFLRKILSLDSSAARTSKP